MLNYEKPNWSLAEIEINNRDLGWAEGTLIDGRPFYLERWQEGDCQLATFYFSQKNLTDYSPEKLMRLLVEAEIVALHKEPLPLDAGEVVDSIGQKLFSVNVVLSDSSEKYAHVTIAIEDFKNE